jgi:DNA-binding response OmpR family regulator
MDNNIKILLIEDDPFLLKMYTTKFELEGFRVITADDGEKGIKTVLSEKPNIILLDLMLPKINGFDVLKRIKENEKTKNIPVILLTNLSQRDEIEKGFALGAVDYLIKAHFMPSEVVMKIKNILNN